MSKEKKSTINVQVDKPEYDKPDKVLTVLTVYHVHCT